MKWTAPIYFVTIFGKSQPTDYYTNNSDVNTTAWKCSPVYDTQDLLTEISLLEALRAEMEDEEKDWLQKLMFFQHVLRNPSLVWS